MSMNSIPKAAWPSCRAEDNKATLSNPNADVYNVWFSDKVACNAQTSNKRYMDAVPCETGLYNSHSTNEILLQQNQTYPLAEHKILLPHSESDIKASNASLRNNAEQSATKQTSKMPCVKNLNDIKSKGFRHCFSFSSKLLLSGQFGRTRTHQTFETIHGQFRKASFLWSHSKSNEWF